MTIEAELDLIWDYEVPEVLFERNHAGGYALPLIGRARICLEGRNGYDPHPEGDEALITPLRREDPETIAAAEPAAGVIWGEICDLVAWHPATPSCWAVRSGEAAWLGQVEW